MELVSTSSQISVCEERTRRINTLSHPPSSSGRRPSSVVLSDGAQAQRVQRGEEQEEEEEEEEEEGEGEWEWKLRQPFYRAAWKQAEMLSQECKSTVWIHWTESCSEKKCITTTAGLKVRFRCLYCNFDVITALQSAASSYGYSTLHPPSPAFLIPHPSSLPLSLW